MSNIVEWNGAGATTYKGKLAYQNENAFPAFLSLFDREQFDTIVEIGTAAGGLTLFLRDNMPNSTIHSFECNMDNVYGNEFAGINIHLADAMTDANLQLINSIILSGNKVLVICDGGCKISEFNTFSKMLKPGDFIMAHDYCDTKENFNNNIMGKFWGWCEIWDEPISDSLKTLIKYTDVDFTYAVWLCCYKG